MDKCEVCVHYKRCADNAGWCKKKAVPVIAGRVACKDFKRMISLMDTKTVTIALERHKELIKAEERLAVIKTITNQPHLYDHDKIRLIQVVLEDKPLL